MLQIDPAVQTEILDLKNFPMPPYDGDIENAQGMPAHTLALVEKINKADAVVISVPEYNGSMSGTFKNIVDWTSRVKDVPWKNRPVLLIGASPGGLGATRGLWRSRIPFDVLGAYLYPDMFGLAAAHNAFTENGQLADLKQTERLKTLLVDYTKFAYTFANAVDRD